MIESRQDWNDCLFASVTSFHTPIGIIIIVVMVAAFQDGAWFVGDVTVWFLWLPFFDGV